MSNDSAPVNEGVEPIRQVQLLMLFAMVLPTDARVAKLLRLALDVDPGPLTTRSDPLDDLHPHSVKEWFEKHLHPDRASKEEQALVDWQADHDNMDRAVAELQNAEAFTGVRLVGSLEPAADNA